MQNLQQAVDPKIFAATRLWITLLRAQGGVRMERKTPIENVRLNEDERPCRDCSEPIGRLGYIVEFFGTTKRFYFCQKCHDIMIETMRYEASNDGDIWVKCAPPILINGYRFARVIWGKGGIRHGEQFMPTVYQ